MSMIQCSCSAKPCLNDTPEARKTASEAIKRLRETCYLFARVDLFDHLGSLLCILEPLLCLFGAALEASWDHFILLGYLITWIIVWPLGTTLSSWDYLITSIMVWPLGTTLSSWDYLMTWIIVWPLGATLSSWDYPITRIIVWPIGTTLSSWNHLITWINVWAFGTTSSSWDYLITWIMLWPIGTTLSSWHYLITWTIGWSVGTTVLLGLCRGLERIAARCQLLPRQGPAGGTCHWYYKTGVRQQNILSLTKPVLAPDTFLCYPTNYVREKNHNPRG